MGHEVIGSWLDECAMPEGMSPHVFDKQLAIKDITEVRAADCIILDMNGESTTGGRMVEWGYALGQTKLHYVIGEGNCIFLKLADLLFKDWNELFEYFKNNHTTKKYTATGMENREFTKEVP